MDSWKLSGWKIELERISGSAVRRGASGALQRRRAALAVELRLFANTGVNRRRAALKLGPSVNAARDAFA